MPESRFFRHDFSAQAGYLPVTKENSGLEAVLADGACTSMVADVLTVAADTVSRSRLYTSGAFADATQARMILEESMSRAAQADRAAVEERLAAGESLEKAAGPYVGEERFELWYTETLRALEEFSG